MLKSHKAQPSEPLISTPLFKTQAGPLDQYCVYTVYMKQGNNVGDEEGS